jgi:hypothetical protein
MVTETQEMVNGKIDMVTNTCELVNDNMETKNADDQLQSENMIVDFDDEVEVIDNDIIHVATCIVSNIIKSYINMNIHCSVINVIF